LRFAAPILRARSAAAVPSDAETMHTVRQLQVLSGTGASVEKELINPHSFDVRIGVESAGSPSLGPDLRSVFGL